MFSTRLRAFPAASQMARHAKAWKFKRPVSQNKEAFWTGICLYKGFKVL